MTSITPTQLRPEYAVKLWDPPSAEVRSFRDRGSKYCICIFVLNENEKLQKQLSKMKTLMQDWDVVIADGGSNDGCNDPEMLRSAGVKAVVIKRGAGKLGAQMRMAFAYALEQGYEGVICVDGNNKDDVIAGVPHFVQKLDEGMDHIQGSRFIPGGYQENTPLARLIGVKLLHSPLISIAAGFRYTDTTNGFRAYSKRFLTRESICLQGARKSGYDLHYFLAIQSGLQKMKCAEVPVTRVYPSSGATPTKIQGFRGNFFVLRVLCSEVWQSSVGVKLKLIALGSSFLVMAVWVMVAIF